MSTISVLFTENVYQEPKLVKEINSEWSVDYTERDKLDYNHGYDIVFTRLGYKIEKYNNIRIIATPTTGLNHLDIKMISNRGIDIISLRDDLAILNKVTSTAEHAWMLLMAMERKLQSAISITQENRWTRNNLELRQISQKRLGIIGFGRLGKMIAEYANAFGLNVFVNDINPAVFVGRKEKNTGIEILLSTCDYVILSASHYPGDPKILGPDLLKLMKTGCTLINISRGELVDENALLNLLQTRKINAGLDVLNNDSTWPPNKTIKNNKLLDYAKTNDNLIITPHIGGYSTEAIIQTRLHLLKKVENSIKKWD